ncbi:hypothetical protein INT48_005457 [Thamnidium elegans]|uniref:Armadillo-like helical domain-containing protein n=1 Tax=Thamnidium elegans TaxID=101142 RepID=A0A8H7VUE8_9FUNG|nr:hypothetical protein INT48_005457 [Thamnidium elegans]
MLSMNNTIKRPEFKEKFVELSQDVFKGSTLSSTFWDNYLILPVNATCITQLIQSKSEESLLDLQPNLSGLFLACLEKLECITTSSMSEKTRQKNAVIILTIVIRNLFSKKRLSHFNIISILTGLDKAETLFSKLVKSIQLHIEQSDLRSTVLQLALVLSAGSDNVNQNGLNGYFMTNDMSVTLFKVLAEKDVDENDIRDIVMLLGMLSNYNKYESRNPYLSYLTKCKQTKPFETMIDMYTSTLTSLRGRYIQLNDDEETLSKSLVTYMSRCPSAQTALLLPLYDLINTNPFFIHTLVNTCTKLDVEYKDDPQSKVTLITSLFSFASYLFQNNRTDRTNIYSRLILTIFLRLTEEISIMNYIAKEGSTANVRLCRQRSPLLPLIKFSRSLFCIILDNMLLFIKHNVRKKLDLLSYNKHKIRLDYHWIELWPTLTSVLHFNALRLEDLQSRPEFNEYLGSFISVFNMCVTYGETFLSDTKSYDSLYYEIIRATQDFIKLSEYVNRSITTKSRGDRSPTITFNEFYNIQLICNHFKPALDEWQAAKNIKFPSPEQVMAIINENYATLELKPMDKLDSYVAFNEIPAEMGFFRQVLRVAVIDYLEYYTWSIS